MRVPAPKQGLCMRKSLQQSVRCEQSSPPRWQEPAPNPPEKKRVPWRTLEYPPFEAVCFLRLTPSICAECCMRDFATLATPPDPSGDTSSTITPATARTSVSPSGHTLSPAPPGSIPDSLSPWQTRITERRRHGHGTAAPTYEAATLR